MRSFGTLIQEAPTNPTPVLSKSVLDRFADVAAYTTGQMPEVNVGERYQLIGTETEVVALRQDGGQVALYDPTASTLTWAARRDLAAHATHLGPADAEILDRAGLATLLASVFNTPLDHTSVAAAGALVDLLGLDEAYEYLDGIMDFEFAEGEDSPWTLDSLLTDARLWQCEQADEATEPQHVALSPDDGFWPTT